MTAQPSVPALWSANADRLVSTLRARLKRRRFHHTLGVCQTALGLAASHGLDPERVGWVALLHDLCKSDPQKGLLDRALSLGEKVPDEDRAVPALWHGWAAAGEAQRDWGLTDPDLLRAIRYHSTGHPDLGPEGKTLMLADILEPTRRVAGRGPLLTLAHRDLDAALAEALTAKCTFIIERGKPLHSRSSEVLAALGVPLAGQATPTAP